MPSVRNSAPHSVKEPVLLSGNSGRQAQRESKHASCATDLPKIGMDTQRFPHSTSFDSKGKCTALFPNHAAAEYLFAVNLYVS